MTMRRLNGGWMVIVLATLVALPAFGARLSSRSVDVETVAASTPILSTPWYSAKETMSGGMPSFSSLVKRVKPAVVNISTTKKVKVRQLNPFQGFGPGMGPNDQFNDFFDRFFGGQQPHEREQHSLGSGFIISDDGTILTNNHVVANADEVTVKMSDGHTFPAKVIGTDEKTDIAVIRITDGKKKLPAVVLGDSTALEVGDWVVAIGNPFGLEQTVTAGIVSAKGRVIGAGPYDDFIQTDASINPGNSGGPLFDMNGRVVGINTAIVASGQGLGFAIPINMAKSLVPQLVKHGRVTDRGWLGVAIQPMTEELAQSFGLEEVTGALIGDVVKESPAEKAGLKRGDVILTFEGHTVGSSQELPVLVASSPAGTVVTLGVLREGKTIEIKATLGQMPSEESKGSSVEPKKSGEPDRLGLEVATLSSEEAHEMGLGDGRGVVVRYIEPNSESEMAGVNVGDVILEINGSSIANESDYAKWVSHLKANAIVRVLIKRGSSTIYLAFRLNK